MTSKSQSTQRDQDKVRDEELVEREESAPDDPDDGDASVDPGEGDASADPGDGDASADPDALKSETTLAGRLRKRLWPTRRRGKILVAGVVTAVLAAAGGGFYWLQQDSVPDDAAFKVGERVVTVEELNHHVDTLRALYGVQAPKDPAKLDRFRRDSAKAVAVSQVLDDVAKGQNVVIADKEARDILARYVAQQFGDGPDTRAKFVQALGNVGTNEKAVLAEIKRQLSITRLFNDVTGGVKVSDEEVDRAFADRKKELATPERRKIRNIVVRSKLEADKLVQRLKSGEDFAAVASQKSIDDSTRAKGGDLGDVAKAQLEGEYAEVAFAAKASHPFGPVKTDNGWNVGQIVRVLPPREANLEKIRDSLKETLTVEKATALWRDWLSSQIRAANVQYADDYRPEHPDEAPGGPPGPPTLPGQQPSDNG